MGRLSDPPGLEPGLPVWMITDTIDRHIGCGLADLHRPVPANVTGSKPHKLVAEGGIEPAILHVMSVKCTLHHPAIQRSVSINVQTIHVGPMTVKLFFSPKQPQSPRAKNLHYLLIPRWLFLRSWFQKPLQPTDPSRYSQSFQKLRLTC